MSNRPEQSNNQDNNINNTPIVESVTQLIDALSISKQTQIRNYINNKTSMPGIDKRRSYCEDFTEALESHLDVNGTVLEVGDLVIILKHGKTGKVGDIARVIKKECSTNFY